ncbi:MAG TPA: hypothetical protein VMA36_07740 [Candidatus Limnocylindria bacterium]|nr:hypothetical protein [Candidatus Limnocylindria bacterium]
MTDPGPSTRVLAALLLVAALGVPPRSASAQNVGFAPGGTVLAAGLFDFLGGRRWRAKLAEAERREAQAEAEARAARADAARAQAQLAQERAARERERGEYARAISHLAAYGRDADDQRALVARLRAQLEQETATALALRRRFGAGERRIADVPAVSPPVAASPRRTTTPDAHPREQHRRATPSPSVGWGTI